MPADFELDMVERTVRSRVWGVVTDERSPQRRGENTNLV